MPTTRIPLIVACLGAHAVVTPVRADSAFPSEFDVTPPQAEPDPYSYAWSDPRMLSVIGIGVTLGGGITGFTDESMRDVVSNPVALAWNVRVSIGTHIPLGIEVTYFGSAAKLVTSPTQTMETWSARRSSR